MKKKKTIPRDDWQYMYCSYDNLMQYIHKFCTPQDIDTIKSMIPKEDHYQMYDTVERIRIGRFFSWTGRIIVKLRQLGYEGYLSRSVSRGQVHVFVPQFVVASNIQNADTHYQMISHSTYDYLRQATSDANVYVHTWFFDLLSRINRMQNQVRHFHIRKDGKLAYTPAHKPTLINDDGKWKVDGRQIMKMGRGVRTIFNSTPYTCPYNENEMTKITEKLISMFNFNGRIIQVNGPEQVKYYYGGNYADYNTGTLGASCMRYDQCSEYVQVLADNDSVEMVVALDKDDKVIGRANLYHDTTFRSRGESQQISFLDRIYGLPITINAIKAYAQEKGYVTKLEQSYSNAEDVVFPNGETKNGYLQKVMALNGNSTIIYMDTFKYGTIINDCITMNTSDGDLELTGTDGNDIRNPRVWVEHLDGYYPECETVYSDYLGEHLHEDYTVWSEYLSTHLLSDDTTYLDLDDDYMPYGHSDIAEFTTFEGFTHYTTVDNVVDGYVPGCGYCLLYNSDVVEDPVLKTWVYERNIQSISITIEDGSDIHINTVLDVEECLDRMSIDELMQCAS